MIMDEFIAIMQFRTAAPFGYGLFLFIWIIITIGSFRKMVIMLFRGQLESPRLYLFSAIFICCIAYLYGAFRYDKNLDMNPIFKDEDVVGMWQYGEAKMILEQSGQARFLFDDAIENRIHMNSGNGYWSREGDFNLVIADHDTDQSSYELFRVIKYHDNYRIIIADFDDPDMWDGSLGFRKVMSSVSNSAVDH